MTSVNKQAKQETIALLTEMSSRSYSVVAAHYRGLTVSELTALRVLCRQNQVGCVVAKNTLAKIAFGKTNFSTLGAHLKGPMILFFSYEHPGAAAKILSQFVKQAEALTVQALSLDGATYDATHLERIAKLPTREEALSMVVTTLQSPVRSLVLSLQDVYGRLVRVVSAIHEKQSVN